ncbi:MAG TPA: NADH pyrophosphatase, partial [Candidatus Corynebacterium faecipullorum]|nr:NADH pyrophosphatase [Candidatus Corynebacterium faecipullorum]
MFLPVTETGLVPVSPQGQPVFVTEPAGEIVVAAGDIHAFLVESEAAERLGTLRDATFFNGQRDILKALHLIRNRREARFDPRTGRELSYPAPGAVGHDGERLVFPRLDPAVIG